jgi:DNA-binding protein H-NS
MSDIAGVQNWTGGPVPFTMFIEQSRPQLTAERDHWLKQQTFCQQNLDRIGRQFAAMEAYEATLAGKTVQGDTATKARRGSRRRAILDILAQSQGLSRGELLAKMGITDDEKGAMSVSNALTGLKKGNQIRSENGKYYREPALT